MRRILLILIIIGMIPLLHSYEKDEQIEYVLKFENIESIYDVGLYAYIQTDSLLIEIDRFTIEKFLKQSEGTIFDIKRHDFRLSGTVKYGRNYIQDERKQTKIDTLFYLAPDRFEMIPGIVEPLDDEALILTDQYNKNKLLVLSVDRCLPYQKGFIIVSDYSGIGFYLDDFYPVDDNWEGYLTMGGNKVVIDITYAEDIGRIGNIKVLKCGRFGGVEFLNQLNILGKPSFMD